MERGTLGRGLGENNRTERNGAKQRNGQTWRSRKRSFFLKKYEEEEEEKEEEKIMKTFRFGGEKIINRGQTERRQVETREPYSLFGFFFFPNLKKKW